MRGECSRPGIICELSLLVLSCALKVSLLPQKSTFSIFGGLVIGVKPVKLAVHPRVVKNCVNLDFVNFILGFSMILKRAK